ncbi:MAG: GAF domain-containing protein [Anaerolineales bacterium]|nr:GAF domain-containing protein [Anaerolineales bacterium]
MTDTKVLTRAPAGTNWRTWLAPAAIIAYQVVALLVFVLTPILVFPWTQAPFLGAFVDNTMQITDDSLFNQDLPAGLQIGDQLVEVAGQPIENANWLKYALYQYSAGETVDVIVQRGGELVSVEVQLTSFQDAGRLIYYYGLYLVGLVYLGVGIWMFAARRDDQAVRAFAIFSASAAIVFAGLFEIHTTQYMTLVWTAALAIGGSALLHMVLSYPREIGIMTRVPFLRLVVYAPALLLTIFTWPRLFNLNNPGAYLLAWQFEYVFFGISLVFFAAGTVYRRYTSPSPIEREQTRVVHWSLIVAFLPVLAGLIANAAGWAFTDLVALLFILPLVAFPLGVAYTILRHRTANADYLLSRGFVYTFLTIGAGASYALIVTGLSLIIGEITVNNHPILIGSLVFVIALLLNPLRLRLQLVVDKLFFRGEEVYSEQLQLFTRELTQIVDLPIIVSFMRRTIIKSMQPERLHIFVYDPQTQFYVSTKDENGQLTSDLRFTNQSGLVRSLSFKQSAIFVGGTDTFPLDLYAEKTRLALLGAQLYVALPGQERLAGWLALGPRLSGDVYSKQDLEFLVSMCEQVALAIERAQVLADKDQRVHDMNVLTRVAQGINITLAFDDILELIYAQASQVLPTDDLSITLYTRATDTLSHVFYLEDDERLEERENRVLSTGVGLESVIVETRRSLMTDDYDRECRGNQRLPDKTGVYAWMSIPLNAGAETIGVISAGSRNPTVVYTEDQKNILQAIADQAAGAIVKARLLEESQRRARQLSTLNEVSRSLSSTLEIDPLLDQILHSAVDILNCEAGSLLLLEEETGDLKFEVVVGPVAEELTGKRMSSGVGLVGKAVQTAEAVIVNNVQQNDDWFDQPAKQTGYETQGLLVVPMIHKERVVGVIEVINKRDGMPFDNDDVELLKAFTGQAAVAVENARLYTLTDQALAARVDELSVMQRIDRELNTSLDVSRAMRITLEWAMRQSDTTAGFIGVVDDMDEGPSSVIVMASEGYTDELTPYRDAPMPLELPILREAIESGTMERSGAAELVTSENATILAEAQSQIAIPIKRETEVIGVLFLESLTASRYTDDSVNFLTRLSDHAAIAISNAQLYGAVQQANLAKSEFVSFVSHELKTPMTSIKGYTDLLAAGSVGEVNDAQRNFLATIRVNVTRMATIVSDLADVSRIEAGRLHLEFAAVPIAEVVDDVVRTAQAAIDERNQNLVLDIPEDLPEVWGDRNRLIQVLTNLLSNAYKYTPEEGTITIKTEHTQNRWDPEGAAEVVHISVTDTGIGIKAEDQQKIFQQYFRTDYGKETAPGTGLGLNITRTLTEMQGGQIWFESEYGKGTSFQFTVPVAEMDLE